MLRVRKWSPAIRLVFGMSFEGQGFTPWRTARSAGASQGSAGERRLAILHHQTKKARGPATSRTSYRQKKIIIIGANPLYRCTANCRGSIIRAYSVHEVLQYGFPSPHLITCPHTSNALISSHHGTGYDLSTVRVTVTIQSHRAHVLESRRTSKISQSRS